MQLSTKDKKHDDDDDDDSQNTQPSNDIDVQEGWEDVTDTDGASQRETATATPSANGTVRKKRRRVQTKPASVATPSVKGRKKEPIVKPEELQDALTGGARYTASYTLDIFVRAIETMRKPLSWLLVLYMIAWLASRVTPMLRTALSPVCIFPWISTSSLCVPVKPVPPVDFERLLNLQGSTFEKLAGETQGSSQLSLGVLRSEMATRDLALVVRYSGLKSRDNIADSLDSIAADAKRTGRSLSRLDAKVIGAIDEVMALNNYAMATIDDAHKRAPSPLLQAVSPFKLGPTAEEIIAETFTLAMDESGRAIGKLILEAEASWQNLEQLDTDIATLHDMVTREDKHTTAEHDKLLAELWSRWGGNRASSREYGERLTLLNDLGEYRKEASTRVKAALRALQMMSDDLEVLRDRVSAPSLLESKVPLHVHMESIQSGLERLQEGRTASRGRRLEYDEMVRNMLNGGLP